MIAARLEAMATRQAPMTHADVMAFSSRVVTGELSDSERAGLASLVVLLGAGMLTSERLGPDGAGDRLQRDEFALRMWEVAAAEIAALLSPGGVRS